MISEIEFTRDYTSFWRTISPLSEDFVRRINVHALARYETELNSSVFSSRRALINEVGFEIFFRCKEKNLSVNEIIRYELGDISHQVSCHIALLRNGAPKFIEEMEATEVDEANEIAKRLLCFFEKFCNVVVRPKFIGCGRIGSCQGDVLADNTLYEIKSGNRSFKSADLRQLVLYLTLNHISKQYDIQNLGLYNPRKGFHFALPHQDFSIHFSGLSTEELCHRISYELTSVNSGCIDPFS